MEPLKRIDENTPIGTRVIVVAIMHVPAVMYRSETSSEPWQLGDGTLVVKVKGKASSYGADFVYVLPEAPQ